MVRPWDAGRLHGGIGVVGQRPSGNPLPEAYVGGGNAGSHSNAACVGEPGAGLY